jgi:hypothetical protein
LRRWGRHESDRLVGLWDGEISKELVETKR